MYNIFPNHPNHAHKKLQVSAADFKFYINSERVHLRECTEQDKQEFANVFYSVFKYLNGEETEQINRINLN